ncbi:hypothetical protein BHM03_00058957 [Ensete ventricosum]|nr:hypothetical protein BHM03_00058957 [Ensete ventricosum]
MQGDQCRWIRRRPAFRVWRRRRWQTRWKAVKGRGMTRFCCMPCNVIADLSTSILQRLLHLKIVNSVFTPLN